MGKEEYSFPIVLKNYAILTDIQQMVAIKG